MRYINMYLIGYVVLLIGALLALGKMGVLGSISHAWLGIGAIIAIGIGLMLAVSAGKPEITR